MVGRPRVAGLEILDHVLIERRRVRVALVVEVDGQAGQAERVEQVRPGPEEQAQAPGRAGYRQRAKDAGDQAGRVESLVDRVDGHRERPAPHFPEQIGGRIRPDAHRSAHRRENLGAGQAPRVDTGGDAAF